MNLEVIEAMHIYTSTAPPPHGIQLVSYLCQCMLPSLDGGLFTNDVAVIGGPCNLRMNPSLGAFKARNDYADQQCRLAVCE